MAQKFRSLRRIAVLVAGIVCAVFLLLILAESCWQKKPFQAGTMLMNSENINDELLRAAGNGDNILLGFLLGQGANCNALDRAGQSALMLAVNQDHLASAELLLQAGADCEYIDPLGRRVLSQAAFAGKLGAVELLLRYKAQINGGAAEGKTALLAACQNGQTAVIAFLLQKKADLWPGQAEGRGPLVTALRNNHIAAVRMILEHDGNINEVDEQNNGVLMLAVLAGSEELVQYILKNHHPDLLHCNNHGETALSIARKNNLKKLVMLLEKAGK